MEAMYHKVSSSAPIRADASAHPNVRAYAIRPSIVTATPRPERTPSFSARNASASTASAICAAEGLAGCVCAGLVAISTTHRHASAAPLMAGLNCSFCSIGVIAERHRQTKLAALDGLPAR